MGRPVLHVRLGTFQWEADFEWLLDQGETYESACRRLGIHARTVMRRYRQVGQPHPPGLAATATTMRKPLQASVADSRKP